MKIHEIRDPIYGFITLNDWERAIIDHPVFQRLRRIKQLGFTDYVYPGATHSRFEHSLGVMHFATMMYDSITSHGKNNIEILRTNLNYDDTGLKRDRQLLRLAALFHDIGHAPYSHVSDELMPLNPNTNKPYKHENYTTKIIQHYFKDIIENHQTNKTNYHISVDEIIALIEGNVKILGSRIFWKILISSQLDADRCDYLLRDSHHIGVKYGVYDKDRLINSLSIGYDPETNDIILGVNEDSFYVAESIVLARYQMFTQVYFHKARRAYDFHFVEVMQKILPNGKLPLPSQIDDYIALDDNTTWNLIKEKGLEEIFTCRQHIREVYHTGDNIDEKDENKLNRIKEKLDKNKILYYVDSAENLWYKLNVKDEDDKEIMIIKEDAKAEPLSKHSNISNKLGGMKKIRVYVKPEDREKAKKIIKEVT